MIDTVHGEFWFDVLYCYSSHKKRQNNQLTHFDCPRPTKTQSSQQMHKNNNRNNNRFIHIIVLVCMLLKIIIKVGTSLSYQYPNSLSLSSSSTSFRQFGGRISFIGAISTTTGTAATTAFLSRYTCQRSSSSSSSLLKLSMSSTAREMERNRVRIENTPVQHIDEDELPQWMPKERTRVLLMPTSEEEEKEDDDDGKNGNIQNNNGDGDDSTGCIVYWMQRDVRVDDNWALLLASHYAQSAKIPLRVVYTMPPPPPPTSSATTIAADDDDNNDVDSNDVPPMLDTLPLTRRRGMFIIGGVYAVHRALKKKHVPLHILMPMSHGRVGKEMNRFVADFNVQMIVTDFSPLRHYREWNEIQTVPLLKKHNGDKKVTIPFYQVDAHNVVPVWYASPKREVGARTLRPKIHKLVNEFLQEYPEFTGNAGYVAAVSKKDNDAIQLPEFDFDTYENYLQLDNSVFPVNWAKPGTKYGMAQFNFFIENGLKHYDTLRNDPTQTNICSGLSQWLNHGHISFQTLLMKVKKLNKYANGTASFIEEGLIRRELSDNYCYYAANEYDTLDAAASWAIESLELHTTDEREYVYTLGQLEYSQTHDDLWNAAQRQVVREGQMHGFLRMYWAKKILEWTRTPHIALRTAQYFNDKYALDGCDPNGFVGVGWSIMGIHDQGWKERPIFGKIRYMNYKGCQRKFKVPIFVQRYPPKKKSTKTTDDDDDTATPRTTRTSSSASTSNGRGPAKKKPRTKK